MTKIVLTLAATAAPLLGQTCPGLDSALPAGTVNIPYQYQLLACPGAQFSAPALPAGLTLAAGGLLQGTPTASAATTVSVTIANPTDGTSSVETLNLSVFGACSHVPKMLPSGEILVYRNGLLQTAGSDYSLSSAALPTITFLTQVGPTDQLSLTLLRSFTLITTVAGQPWTGVGYRLYRENWACGAAGEVRTSRRPVGSPKLVFPSTKRSSAGGKM